MKVAKRVADPYFRVMGCQMREVIQLGVIMAIVLLVGWALRI